MIFDTHIHTRDHSPDARVRADVICRMAGDAGLDGIILTDHDYVWYPHEIDMLRRETGNALVILSGAEICFDAMHLVVFGCPPGPVPLFVQPGDVIAWVRKHGGAVVVAHPFGPATVVDRDTIVALGADGVEAFNGRRKQMERERIAWVESTGLAVIGATDFHGRGDDRIGRCGTEVPGGTETMADVVRAIRERRTAAVVPGIGCYED